jgi:hypothetical protein
MSTGWICPRCGGSTKGKSVTGMEHRHSSDCIAHLKAIQAELYELLEQARAHLYHHLTPKELYVAIDAALAKARGETPTRGEHRGNQE